MEQKELEMWLKIIGVKYPFLRLLYLYIGIF